MQQASSFAAHRHRQYRHPTIIPNYPSTLPIYHTLPAPTNVATLPYLREAYRTYLTQSPPSARPRMNFVRASIIYLIYPTCITTTTPSTPAARRTTSSRDFSAGTDIAGHKARDRDKDGDSAPCLLLPRLLPLPLLLLTPPSYIAASATIVRGRSSRDRGVATLGIRLRDRLSGFLRRGKRRGRREKGDEMDYGREGFAWDGFGRE